MSSFVSDDRVPSSFLGDKVRVVRDLHADWTRFHTDGTVGSHTRSVIARSWDRSRQLAVSPDRRAADVERGALRGFDSRDQVKRLLLDAAAPIRRLLSDELDGSNSAVVLCDDAGRMIARDGDASILRRTEAQNFVPGADWSEECAGTNGIGLALALGRPAQVFSAEHFCAGFQDYACTAAPLRHPVTREMIGVLDVTTRASEITHHTFAMVVHAARAIEHEMEEHVFGRERELLERYLRGRVGQDVPFFTVDRSGRTIIQNAVAAEALPSEDLPAVMHIVRRSLRSGSDAESELDLSTGRGVVECHVVRADGDPIGALVAVRPLRPTRAARSSSDWQPLVGRSPGIREVLARAQRVAELHVPAVIVGEAGTGKLTLALAMHDCSARGERLPSSSTAPSGAGATCFRPGQSPARP